MFRGAYLQCSYVNCLAENYTWPDRSCYIQAASGTGALISKQVLIMQFQCLAFMRNTLKQSTQQNNQFVVKQIIYSTDIKQQITA